MRIKLQDVASLAGVSEATVSRVMNGKEGVSPRTKANVVRVLAELGYEPAALRTSPRAGSIGLLVPELDNILFQLVTDLKERGLLDNTLVIAMGEFGRTPWLNEARGRDHYPKAWSLAMAGAGIRGGTVFGATDDIGAEVADSPVDNRRLFATIWLKSISGRGCFSTSLKAFLISANIFSLSEDISVTVF